MDFFKKQLEVFELEKSPEQIQREIEERENHEEEPRPDAGPKPRERRSSTGSGITSSAPSISAQRSASAQRSSSGTRPLRERLPLFPARSVKKEIEPESPPEVLHEEAVVPFKDQSEHLQEIATLRQELDAQRQEFLALRTAAEALEAESRQRDATVTNLRKELYQRDAELRLRNDQFVELQQASRLSLLELNEARSQIEKLQLQLTRVAATDGAGRNADHRKQLAELDTHRQRSSELKVRVHELQELLEYQTKERAETERRLEAEVASLRGSNEELRSEFLRLTAQLRQLEADSSRQVTPDLRQWESDIIRAARQESNRLLMGAPANKPNDTQQVYLKNLVVNLLCEEDHAIKATLVPLIATLLAFSPAELQAVYSRNPTWRQRDSAPASSSAAAVFGSLSTWLGR